MSKKDEDTKIDRVYARGKHTPGCGYEPMNHWVVCDSCGFDIRAFDIKETWDHRQVCPTCWEPRQPQDFVRTKQDTIAAQGPIRTPPADINIDVTYVQPQQPIPPGTFNPNTL